MVRAVRSGGVRRPLVWMSLFAAFVACSSSHEEETVGSESSAVVADAEATGVYGQAGAFDTATFNKGGRSADSLAAPFALSVADDDSLFVADTSNSRVLHFPAGSTTADRVYGQAGDFTQGLENNGGVSAGSLRAPQGLAYFTGDAGQPAGLFVADTQNNRVLFFDGNSTTATRVVGQADFSSVTPSVAADRLNQPTGLAVSSSGELYVADRGNHRVLKFPPGSGTADKVWGQFSLTTNTANLGGVGPATLNGPADVALDGSGSLFIADTTNRRVLRYSLAGNIVANAVWGQSDFASNGSGIAANRFSYPQGLLSLGGDLLVSDSLNHRVLRFSTATSASSATQVFGQLGAFDTGTANKGGVGPRSLRTPVGLGVSSDGTLFIADSANSRTLSYAA
ncbi:MAG: NHL repeat-containing protein, partial [Myxococcales bacterium]|nr:NHL repeat-containing protein [Myxococcales bacterium]